MKLTYEYVKGFIKKEGYTLLSDTYINNQSKLLIKCSEGHEYNTPFNYFQGGCRCPICAGNKKHSYEYVKQFVESIGYTLLSDTYKNSRMKLLIICDKGHKYSVTFGCFKQGQRCPICAGNTRCTYDYVKSFIESINYTLLSDSYVNSKGKLLIVCDKGHEYITTFGRLRNGHKCCICSGNKKHSYEYIKNYIEKEGYTLLSDTYKNASSKLPIKCNNDHKYNVTFGNFRSGFRCPICAANSQSSRAEVEVQDYVESLGISIIRNDRTQIINPLTGCNLELDVWIPSMNKAIEYNGLYWHSLFDSQAKDKIKVEQCRETGIDLLIVNEFNWVNNRELEKVIIRDFVNLSKYNVNKFI